MKNEELRVRVEELVETEKAIDAAVTAHADQSWAWAEYGKPSTGGPYMWNDIEVVTADGRKRLLDARTYVEESA